MHCIHCSVPVPYHVMTLACATRTEPARSVSPQDPNRGTSHPRSHQHAPQTVACVAESIVVQASRASNGREFQQRRPIAAVGRPRRTLATRSGGATILQAFGEPDHAPDSSAPGRRASGQLRRGSRGAGRAVTIADAYSEAPAAGLARYEGPLGRRRPRLRHLVLESEHSSGGDSATDSEAAVATAASLSSSTADVGGRAWHVLSGAASAAAALLGLHRRSPTHQHLSPLSRASLASSPPSMHSRSSAGGGGRTVVVAGGGEAARTRRPGARGRIIVQAQAEDDGSSDSLQRGARASRGPNAGAHGRAARSALAAVLVQPQDPEEAEEEDTGDPGLPSRASRSSVNSLSFWQRVSGILVQPPEEPEGHGRRSRVYHTGAAAAGAPGTAVRVQGGRAVRRGVLQVQRSEESTAEAETWASWLSRASVPLRATSQSSSRSAAAPGFVVQHSSPSVLAANAIESDAAVSMATDRPAGGPAQRRKPRSRPRGLIARPAEDDGPGGGDAGMSMARAGRASRRPDMLPVVWRQQSTGTAAPRRFADVLQDMEAPEHDGDSDDDGDRADAVAALLAAQAASADMWSDLHD